MTEVDPTWRDCAECGKRHRRSYRPGKNLDRMVRDCLCFECAHWSLAAENPPATVIDHFVYGPGSRIHGEFRGMGGRRFDVEYLADGRRITTFDLWGGGLVPERYWDRIPDTAKFINGGERVQVGETTCFNPTSGRAEYNPLPDGRRVEIVNGRLEYAK